MKWLLGIALAVVASVVVTLMGMWLLGLDYDTTYRIVAVAYLACITYDVTNTLIKAIHA